MSGRYTKSDLPSGVGPYISETFYGRRRRRTIYDDEPLFASKYSPIVLIALLIFVFTWVKYVDSRLPTMLLERDAKVLPPDRYERI